MDELLRVMLWYCLSEFELAQCSILRQFFYIIFWLLLIYLVFSIEQLYWVTQLLPIWNLSVFDRAEVNQTISFTILVECLRMWMPLCFILFSAGWWFFGVGELVPAVWCGDSSVKFWQDWFLRSWNEFSYMARLRAIINCNVSYISLPLV
jgi:hypothetical protein